METRMVKEWSNPTILTLVEFFLNNTDNSEIGMTPYHLHFGTLDATYYQIPSLVNETNVPIETSHEFVKLLDNNIQILRETTINYQRNLINERKLKQSVKAENKYQPGDLILYAYKTSQPLPTKLTPRNQGPYEVIKHIQNDVTCRHMATGVVKVLENGTRMHKFFGTRDEAIKVAMIDQDQYLISEILAYRGDPDQRTTMEFEVRFADDSIVWVPWSRDLFDSIPYEEYCRSVKQLLPLLYTVQVAATKLKELGSAPIQLVNPGDTVYVNLRFYNELWYINLNLPDCLHVSYLVPFRYTQWTNNNNHKRINAKCPLFNEEFKKLSNVFVHMWGSQRQFSASPTQVLVDEQFIIQYPQILPNQPLEAPIHVPNPRPRGRPRLQQP